ncbi:MAG: class I SAM-dependent methyltransferase [Candidatus Nomurabacteria bacterium]|nr:class I SAM-dependent methyltransferase [Candidatus Nomurabacteria bacterium]
MHEWEKAYKDKKFFISKKEHSLIVGGISAYIDKNSRVLDLGCGQGRNSIFLAEQGHSVDAVDVANVHDFSSLSLDIKQNINFYKCSVVDFPFGDKKYDAIIMARLIQYLEPLDVVYIIESVWIHLESKGYIGVSFTSKGGIFSQPDIKIGKYHHDIDWLVGVLERVGFSNINVTKGASRSVGVPYDGDVSSYDIIANKK